MKMCATCYYWMGAESAYRAPCGLDAAYGGPAFDDGCPQRRPRGTPRQDSITLHPSDWPRKLLERLGGEGEAMKLIEQLQRVLVE